jgi:asparagine synthase (glutamine-hydrolysing)
MCSIYGSLGKNYKNIERTFSKELHHRGPDDSGIYYDDTKSLILGHTRLSIIDLSNHAHQPMNSEDEKYILVFNGEIYNYQEIKKKLISLGYKFNTSSDTEVVLKSYMEFGQDCVSHFRGMFSFCIYDKQKEEIFLARDRFGIKPLLYTFLDDQFIFSSELKPFLKSNIINKKLSHQSANEYFQYGSVKQPNTMLEGVYQLMPGHSMRVKLDRAYEVKKYYDYVKESNKLPKIESYDEAVQKVREELEVTTKYHMVADVEVGSFLSGGVDSTAVVAMMKKYSDKQINTFSLGFKHKINIEDETDIASRSAKQLGCKHHNIKIDDTYVKHIFDDFIGSIDQPSIDGINTYIVSRETAKEMKVALSGLGGDEIFAGYPHFKTINKCSQKKKGATSFIGQQLNKIRANRFTNKYEYVGEDESLALNKLRTINRDLSKILKNNSTLTEENALGCKIQNSKFKELSSIQKISKAEIDNYMLNTLLRDNDVLSMAHSLEVRPILLDHKLVELAFSLHDSFKVRDGMLKSVFVDSVKDIIPSEVWQRKKTGFEMPVVNWMNGGLNKDFVQVAYSQNANKIFNQNYLKNLQDRVKSKNLKRVDWMSFVFLSWFYKYDIEI